MADSNLINNPVPGLEMAGNLDRAERKSILEKEKLMKGHNIVHSEDAGTTESPFWRVWLVDWILGVLSWQRTH